MKIVELINHIQMPINNEEADVLSKFDENVAVEKSSLDDREQYLVNQLVNKGALIRKNNNGKIEYSRYINR